MKRGVRELAIGCRVSVFLICMLLCTSCGGPSATADPTERIGAVEEVVNGKMYVIGGMTLRESLRSVAVYDPAADTWTSANAIPTDRTMAASAVLNGCIYVIGGRNPEGGVVAQVERFDPAKDTWTPCRDMATPRWGHSAVAVSGTIFVFGGITGVGDNRRSLGSVLFYDPQRGTWTKGVSMPAPRHSPSAAVANNQVFLISGKSVAYPQANSSPAITDTVHRLEPATGSWTTVAPIPHPRVSSTAVVVDDLIYVMGGMDRDGGLPTTIDVYDPGTDKWTEGTMLQESRRGQCGVCVDDIACPVGGAAGRYGRGKPTLLQGIERVVLRKGVSTPE